MRQNQPVKKLIFAVITAAIVLSGCGGPATTSSEFVSSTAVASTPADSSAALCSTTENKPVLPSPVSGSYNGQTVTMQYTVKTNLPIEMDYCRPFQNGFAIVSRADNNKLSFIDENGQVLGGMSFSFAYPFESDGRALVQKTDYTWAYIDKTGKVIAETTKSESPGTDMSMFYEENALWGLLDEEGNRLTEPIYEFVHSFINGYACVLLSEGEHKNVLIDRTGKVLLTLPDDCSFAAVSKDNTYIACTFTGKNDIADTRYQLLDMTGVPLHEQRFKAISNFEDGLAPVMVDGMTGLMDEKGNIIIEPSLPMDDNYQVDLEVSDGKIVCCLDGMAAIITVTRS